MLLAAHFHDAQASRFHASLNATPSTGAEAHIKGRLFAAVMVDTRVNDANGIVRTARCRKKGCY
jgi:hypothetical protein